ncbi:phage tail tape measure protein [Thermoactinomyces daqus]|nr:phage tail tape measure protein [Thermoactinomyces daqus]
MAEEILSRIKGEVTLDSKGFAQGVAQINRQLNVLKTEFDASRAKVRAFGKSQDQLKTQAQLLARQIELQKQKVSLLAQTHQEYSQKIGAEAKQTQQLASQLNRAKTALTNMEGSYQRLNAQLGPAAEMQQRYTRALDQLERKMRLIQSEFRVSEAQAKAFGDSIDQTRVQISSLEKQIELQRQRVNLLSLAYKDATRNLGKNASETREAAVRLNEAKAALAGLEGQLRQANRNLATSSLAQSFDQLEQKMRLVQSEFQISEAQAKAFGKSTDQIRVQISGLEKQIEFQREKIHLLSIAYNDAAQSLGKNAKQTQEAAIRLNEARAALTGMEGSLKRLSTQLSQQNSWFGRFGQNMFHVRDQAIETGAALGVMSAGLAVAFGSAVKKAADFEAQLSSIQAVTGASAQEMEQFRQLAIQMGAQTKFSATEAAQGIEELAKAGVSTSDILNGGLKGALDLAAAGELDLAEAAQIASTALNAFRSEHLSVAEAANILAGAANASATDVKEMNLGLSQVAAVAASAGLSFKDTATALAVFAQNGLKSSDAGTSLKTMLLNLTPSSKQAADEMKKLGIITKDGKNQFFDAQGRVKSFAEIAGVLQKQLAGLSEEQRNQALKTIFGTDAIRAANIAFKEGASGVRAMSDAMSKTTAADVAAKRMDNLKGTIEQLNGAWETFQIQVGSAFLPILKELAKDLNAVVDWFSKLSPSTKEALGIFTATTAGILALGGAIAGIIAIANPFTAAVAGAAIVIGGLSAASYKLNQDMKQNEENAIRFGYGVSQGTIQAAKGYMDLRDKALVNLAQLRISSGAEAQRIVNETVNIFAQMGDKITAALNQDKINVQKAAAGLLDQVPKALQPAVQNVTDTAIKAIDAQVRRVQDANKIIRQGLIQYGGNVSKMPKQFAAAYQQAIKDLDQTSRTFVQRIDDLNSYMENMQADQGKITAQGAKQWLADINKTYDQAIKAAHKWADEQRKVWEEQFANGNITKDQYDLMSKVINETENQNIAVAKQTRAKAMKELQKDLSDEAYLYDYQTGKMLDRYEGYVTAKAGLMKSDQELMKEGKERFREYSDSIIQDADRSTKEVKKRQQELIKEYGNMGTASVNQLADMIKKGGKQARIATEALAVQTRDGFKINLGPEGMVTVNSFIKGLQTGKYTVRDIAIAHMSQLRAVYGDGNFTQEGIKAIESFTNGLRSKKPEEIANQLGLDLKSKMKIDLGPLGKVSAQTFAKGLSDGTYTFDAVYTYFRNQLNDKMKFDLSAEGKHNIETLKLGMQAGAIDLQEAAAVLGLNIKSKLKVNLGSEGQFTIATLLAGLQSGKIDIETFAKGIKEFLKLQGMRIDLTAEGKAAGDSHAKGLNASKPNIQKAASSLKSTTEKTLGSATDGGGGKKVGSEFTGGISSNKGKAANAASSVAGAAKSNLHVSGTYSLGLAVASGFANGILGGKWGVISAAGAIAEAAWATIKKKMGIHSPSRVTMELGKYTALGFEEGMKSRLSQIRQVSNLLSQAALPVAVTGSGSAGAGATVQSVNSNVSAPVSMVFQFNRPVFLQNRADMQRLAEELTPFISSAINKQDTLVNRAKGVIQFGS